MITTPFQLIFSLMITISTYYGVLNLISLIKGKDLTGSPYIGYKFIINPPTTLSKYFLIINTDSLIDYLFKIPLNLQKSNK